MKKYLISIGGGSTSNVLNIENNFDEIIAVDSGIDHLFELSLNPSTLIGDLDSISKSSLDKVKEKGIKIVSFNTKKDQTDFELAIDYLQEPDKSQIFIIGGESGEIDHLISIFLLIPSKSFYEKITWLYGDKKIIFRKELNLNLQKSTKFSLIPLSDLSNLSIDGAEWNLENKNIKFGQSLTLRNVAVEDEINIYSDKGIFAFIY